jgi:HK97 gp10 family phage protein
MSVKIDQGDLKLLKKRLDNLRTFDKKTLSNEIGRTALEISRLAKQNAPVDTGTLKQSIRAEKKGKIADVVAGAKYAPYVEFGTGGNVDLTDMEALGIPSSYAAQFKGKGIKNINLPARPFFFSSARIGFNNLLNRLKGEINNAIN